MQADFKPRTWNFRLPWCQTVFFAVLACVFATGVSPVTFAAEFLYFPPESAAYESGYESSSSVVGSTFVSPGAIATGQSWGDFISLSAPDARPVASSVTPAEAMLANYDRSCPRTSDRWGIWDLDACVRGYYVNDQRIQWTGNEETFGVEAAIAPRVRHTFNEWETSVEGDFYLNQPFDRNILVDTPERVSYRGNFEIPVLEISQLFISASRDNWTVTLGKFETPFGRTYFPLFTNARIDAPFIRTESIHWRETGILGRYSRGPFVADVAFANGSQDMDTNSSKALVSRLGLDGEYFALGFSTKVHDGVGSEGQKQFNNHIGFDAMVRRGGFTLSSELIYDEYGFRRAFDPLDITWGRSIYYRDQNYRLHSPVTGMGYYVDLLCDLEPFTVSLNYGEYYPQQLGIPQHDVTQRRGVLKGTYAATPSLQFYAAGILETGGYIAQAGRSRRGWAALFGLQWSL